MPRNQSVVQQILPSYLVPPPSSKHSSLHDLYMDQLQPPGTEDLMLEHLQSKV